MAQPGRRRGEVGAWQLRPTRAPTLVAATSLELPLVNLPRGPAATTRPVNLEPNAVTARRRRSPSKSPSPGRRRNRSLRATRSPAVSVTLAGSVRRRTGDGISRIRWRRHRDSGSWKSARGRRETRSPRQRPSASHGSPVQPSVRTRHARSPPADRRERWRQPVSDGRHERLPTAPGQRAVDQSANGVPSGSAVTSKSLPRRIGDRALKSTNAGGVAAVSS